MWVEVELRIYENDDDSRNQPLRLARASIKGITTFGHLRNESVEQLALYALAECKNNYYGDLRTPDRREKKLMARVAELEAQAKGED